MASKKFLGVLLFLALSSLLLAAVYLTRKSSDHISLPFVKTKPSDIYLAQDENSPLTIELMFSFDQSFGQHFQDNNKVIERFFYALYLQMQLLFQSDTLGLNFRLLVKDFIFWPEKYDILPLGEQEFILYLDEFCKWQDSIRNKYPDKCLWDHAILFTGYDFISNSMQLQGIGKQGGMCTHSLSCSINAISDFSAARIAVHEIAHNLGVHHDSHECDSNNYIMSPEDGAGQMKWSKCSAQMMVRFIKKLNNDNNNCLLNGEDAKNMFDDRTRYPEKLPGRYADLSEQCFYVMGEGAYPAMSTKPSDYCDLLLCSNRTMKDVSAHPALDGSECGSAKSCWAGECVD